MNKENFAIVRPEPTIDYCVLHYFNQWLSEDRYFIDALRKAGPPRRHREILDKFCGFYKIRRCFPKISDKKYRLEKVRKALLADRDEGAVADPKIWVRQLDRRLKKQYSTETQPNHRKLSAASKLAWLQQRAQGKYRNYRSREENVVIFDSKVCLALEFAGSDYDKYVACWRETYEPFKNDIERSSAKLSRLLRRKYHPFNLVRDYRTQTADHVKFLEKEEWVWERVFDIYLWFLGDRGYVLVDEAECRE